MQPSEIQRLLTWMFALLLLAACGKPAATKSPWSESTLSIDLEIDNLKPDGTQGEITCTAKPSVEKPEKWVNCKGDLTLDEVVTVLELSEMQTNEDKIKLRKENDQLREALYQAVTEDEKLKQVAQVHPKRLMRRIGPDVQNGTTCFGIC